MTRTGVQSLTKRYGGTAALDDVSMSITAGQVRALLGQNGAGKSTLIGCLGGRTRPDGGTMWIDGQPHTSLSPRQSLSAGVAVIYQHLSVIDSLSVADNIFLGDERTRAGVIRRREQHSEAASLLERIGAACEPDEVVGSLPMGQRQLVEIAKALRRDAKLLILDEPTAALSEAEAESLAHYVQRLRDEGIAIVYVTHLLNEVARLADTVTVMRNGRVVLDESASSVDRRTLVSAITGEAPSTSNSDRHVSDSAAEPRLRVVGLRGRRVGPIDLEVRRGEILGLIGTMGSGKTSLLEMIAKTRRAEEGSVLVDDRPVRGEGPSAGLAAGTAFVPADRQRDGLFAGMSAIDNALIAQCGRLARAPWRAFAREQSVFADVAHRMSIRPADPNLPVDRLSGGNQQKVLLSRWVNSASNVKVLLLDDPTQGVDVGARQEIYGVVRDIARSSGLAVIFATSEPEELLQLADRAYIMKGGQVSTPLDLAHMTEDTLAAMIHSPEATDGVTA